MDLVAGVFGVAIQFGGLCQGLRVVVVIQLIVVIIDANRNRC